jgi:HEPN domain-containing protein
MNRRDFQSLSRLRTGEARILLNNAAYEGAYYLARYAVECGLKACIARRTRLHDFPPDPRTVQKVYVHDLTQLVEAAGLKQYFEHEIETNQAFAANWAVVKEWSEHKRYWTEIPRQDAEDLFSAITARKNGVLSWLKRYW